MLAGHQGEVGPGGQPQLLPAQPLGQPGEARIDLDHRAAALPQEMEIDGVEEKRRSGRPAPQRAQQPVGHLGLVGVEVVDEVGHPDPAEDDHPEARRPSPQKAAQRADLGAGRHRERLPLDGTQRLLRGVEVER